ncbi:MAG: hypothetical protein ACOY94_03380 [Bacillota bacterium]
MNARTLWVPIKVLNSTTHSTSTRLIWLLLGLRSSGAPSSLTNIRLRKLSGLDRKTIAAAHATLAQAPLAPCYGRPHPSCAAIPVALLTLVPPHRNQCGPLKRAVAKLVAAGWLMRNPAARVPEPPGRP